MAGDNTIGWQDKKDYRAKLTIAKAAVRQVQREEVKDAMRAKTLPKGRAGASLDAAVEAGVISADEATTFREAEQAALEAVTVDAFGDWRSFAGSEAS